MPRSTRSLRELRELEAAHPELIDTIQPHAARGGYNRRAVSLPCAMPGACTHLDKRHGLGRGWTRGSSA